MQKIKYIFRNIIKYGSWIILLIAAISMIYYYFAVKPQRIERAEQNSQRIIYNLEEEKFEVFIPKNDNTIKPAPQPLQEEKRDIILPKEEKNNISGLENNHKPKIAFLIINLGLSESTTKMALALPPEVSIGLSSYSSNISFWEKEFQNDGHEIFAELPLEPEDYRTEDRGFLSMLSYNDDSQNIENLNIILNKYSKPTGLYSYGSEVFTKSEKAQVIFDKIYQNNLLYIYASPAHLSTEGSEILNRSKIQYISNPIVLDEDVSEITIISKLHSLEEQAKKNGYAIAIFHPYPISIKAVTQWIESSKNSNQSIVKISDIFRSTIHE